MLLSFPSSKPLLYAFAFQKVVTISNPIQSQHKVLQVLQVPSSRIYPRSVKPLSFTFSFPFSSCSSLYMLSSVPFFFLVAFLPYNSLRFMFQILKNNAQNLVSSMFPCRYKYLNLFLVLGFRKL